MVQIDGGAPPVRGAGVGGWGIKGERGLGRGTIKGEGVCNGYMRYIRYILRPSAVRCDPLCYGGAAPYVRFAEFVSVCIDSR
jgi:hypothetical protein